jgi:hypothetical protein
VKIGDDGRLGCGKLPGRASSAIRSLPCIFCSVAPSPTHCVTKLQTVLAPVGIVAFGLLRTTIDE